MRASSHPLTILSGCVRRRVGALMTSGDFPPGVNLDSFVGDLMLIGHREEECHHDDRFRRCEAERTEERAGRKHLSGRPRQIPVFSPIFLLHVFFSDDHDGGPMRNLAHRDGLGGVGRFAARLVFWRWGGMLSAQIATISHHAV